MILKKLIKISLILLLLCLIVGYIVGPSRLYGQFFSQELIADVKDIRSCMSKQEDRPETFAIELQTDAGEIYVATSTESSWAVVSKGNRVKVKLCPAAPWSESDGSWINAKLLNKIVKK